VYFRSYRKKIAARRSVEDASLKNPAEELSKLDIVYLDSETRGRAVR